MGTTNTFSPRHALRETYPTRPPTPPPPPLQYTPSRIPGGSAHVVRPAGWAFGVRFEDGGFGWSVVVFSRGGRCSLCKFRWRVWMERAERSQVDLWEAGGKAVVGKHSDDAHNNCARTCIWRRCLDSGQSRRGISLEMTSFITILHSLPESDPWRSSSY